MPLRSVLVCRELMCMADSLFSFPNALLRVGWCAVTVWRADDIVHLIMFVRRLSRCLLHGGWQPCWSRPAFDTLP